jgi:peptidoglycan hydrolase-like protein with peptidoglycan-binding domain
VIGTGTRAALKAWQKSQGITADGYLTPDLVKRLAAAADSRSDAPGSPHPPDSSAAATTQP